MKKTWILQFTPGGEKVIVVDGDQVYINGIPTVVTKQCKKRLLFNDESTSTPVTIQDNAQELTRVHQYDSYIITRDFNLKSFGFDQQLYLNGVNLETGHVLGTRRNITLYDIALLVSTYIFFIFFGFGIILLLPILLIVYFIAYSNRVVIISEMPVAKIPPSDYFTIVGPQPQQIPPQPVMQQQQQNMNLYPSQYVQPQQQPQPQPQPYIFYHPGQVPQQQQPIYYTQQQPPILMTYPTPYLPNPQPQSPPQIPASYNYNHYTSNNYPINTGAVMTNNQEDADAKISEKVKLID